MSDHNELGKIGEKIAKEYLINKGYKILATNWRYLKAEIDIIAQKENDTIHIIEVKTRVNIYAGNPEEFVTPKKIKLLVNAAHEFIISNGLDCEVQFDIIAIVKNSKYETINHIENAFYHF